MKQTIILLMIFALALIGVILPNQNASSSKLYTCCQQFLVLDHHGNPVANCHLTLNSITDSCTTNASGICTICGLTPNASNNVLDCNGTSVAFNNCATTQVTIQDP